MAEWLYTLLFDAFVHPESKVVICAEDMPAELVPDELDDAPPQLLIGVSWPGVGA